MFSKELRKSRYVCVFFKKKHMCFCLLMSNSQSFCISPFPQSNSQIPWGCLVEMHLEKRKINFQGGGIFLMQVTRKSMLLGKGLDDQRVRESDRLYRGAENSATATPHLFLWMVWLLPIPQGQQRHYRTACCQPTSHASIFLKQRNCFVLQLISLIFDRSSNIQKWDPKFKAPPPGKAKHGEIEKNPWNVM